MPSENVFINENYCHPDADDEDFCAFFDKGTGKCSVHPVKPETCKAGPVTFDINLRTGRVEWFLKKGSVCALAEQLYQCGEKFEEHFKAARTELLGLICGLDGEALKAILRIPEPETFKVGDEELPEGVAEKLGDRDSSSD